MSTAAVAPARRRWRIDDHGSVFIVTIKPEWSWLSFISLPLFAVGLTYVLMKYGGKLRALGSSYAEQKGSLGGLLLILGIPGLLVFSWFAAWLWNLGGCEIVTLGNEELVLRKEIFGIGFNRRFELKRVSDICFFEIDSDGYFAWITFKYADRFSFIQRGFGYGIDSEEANVLIDTILVRFPQLSRAAAPPTHLLKFF
jgi:hypothetical protein